MLESEAKENGVRSQGCQETMWVMVLATETPMAEIGGATMLSQFHPALDLRAWLGEKRGMQNSKTLRLASFPIKT